MCQYLRDVDISGRFLLFVFFKKRETTFATSLALSPVESTLKERICSLGEEILSLRVDIF